MRAVKVGGKLLLCLRKCSGHDVSNILMCLKTITFDEHHANEMRAAQNLFATEPLSDLLGMSNNCKFGIRRS